MNALGIHTVKLSSGQVGWSICESHHDLYIPRFITFKSVGFRG
jgi:hypothetical protein